MKRNILPIIIGIAAVTMLLASNAGASAPELRRNPFDRPLTVLLNTDVAPASNASISESGPLLRAVLSAGPKSVVDFGGVILRIGESADGYQLLSVDEGGATFKRDGEKVVFSFYEQEQAEDQ